MGGRQERATILARSLRNQSDLKSRFRRSTSRWNADEQQRTAATQNVLSYPSSRFKNCCLGQRGQVYTQSAASAMLSLALLSNTRGVSEGDLARLVNT